jgi:hypothetical protein
MKTAIVYGGIKTKICIITETPYGSLVTVYHKGKKIFSFHKETFEEMCDIYRESFFRIKLLDK